PAGARVAARGHRAVAAARGEAPDEGAVVLGPGRHAETVAQERAARNRAFRVAGQHGDRLAGAAYLLDQFARQAALADAARPGDRDDTRRAGRGGAGGQLFAPGRRGAGARPGASVGLAGTPGRGVMRRRRPWSRA